MLCESTLDEAGLTLDEVDDIILVGGSTRIPAVKASIERVFKKEPIVGGNVDEMVALGASLYAALKSDKQGLNSMQKASLKQIKVADVANHCFGTIALSYNEITKQEEYQNVIMINKNTKLPVKKVENMLTVHDGQKSLKLTVTQSTSPETDPKFVKIIWEDTMDMPPNRPKGQPIKITYSYDENQIMHCVFEDVNSKTIREVYLKPEEDKLEDSAIDKFLVD